MIKSALFSVVPSGPWGLATVSFRASDQESQASSQVALSCGYFVHPRCHAGNSFRTGDRPIVQSWCITWTGKGVVSVG